MHDPTRPGAASLSGPTAAEDLKRRAQMLLSAGDYAGARALVLPLAARHPQDAEIQTILGQAAELAGNHREALRRYTQADKLVPGRPMILLLIARLHRAMTDYESAHKVLDRLLTAHPTFGQGLLERVRILREQNRLDEAGPIIDRALQRTPEDPHVTLALAATAKALGCVGPAIDRCRARLEDPGLDFDLRHELLFTIARLLDTQGDYDAAFEHYSRANAMLPEVEGEIAAHYTHAWTPEFLAKFQRREQGGREAIFIVGMPRSGTTLTEQILASHPKLRTVGENAMLGYLARPASTEAFTPQSLQQIGTQYLEHILPAPKPPKPGKKKKAPPRPDGVINKMPDNYKFLGVIALSMPDARVIYCKRNPIDTCLSNFFQNFGLNHPWTRRLETCAARYRFHAELMEHWREVLDLPIHTSVLEELTADPETRTRALCQHLGIEYDARCLEFHKTSRSIGTASTEQIRAGITHNPEPRWKRYEKHLAPLIDALGDLASA